MINNKQLNITKVYQEFLETANYDKFSQEIIKFNWTISDYKLLVLLCNFAVNYDTVLLKDEIITIVQNYCINHNINNKILINLQNYIDKQSIKIKSIFDNIDIKSINILIENSKNPYYVVGVKFKNDKKVLISSIIVKSENFNARILKDICRNNNILIWEDTKLADELYHSTDITINKIYNTKMYQIYHSNL